LPSSPPAQAPGTYRPGQTVTKRRALCEWPPYPGDVVTRQHHNAQIAEAAAVTSFAAVCARTNVNQKRQYSGRRLARGVNPRSDAQCAPQSQPRAQRTPHSLTPIETSGRVTLAFRARVLVRVAPWHSQPRLEASGPPRLDALGRAHTWEHFSWMLPPWCLVAECRRGPPRSKPPGSCPWTPRHP